MINSKKCLTLNLSKGPNFVVTFLFKNVTLHSCIPTSLVNLSKKTSLLLLSYDFRKRHQVLTRVFFSTVTVTVWLVTTSQLWHHRPADPRVGYGDFQLRDVMWHCDAVTYLTVVYPTYHDQKSVNSINLTFSKNVIKEKKLES